MRLNVIKKLLPQFGNIAVAWFAWADPEGLALPSMYEGGAPHHMLNIFFLVTGRTKILKCLILLTKMLDLRLK